MSARRTGVSIVTGGGGGIGEALCVALAQRGDRVVVADRDGERAEGVAKRIVDAGGAAWAATLDVTDSAAFKALSRETLLREGSVDRLFNNAGVGLAGEVRDLALSDWERVIDVNLRGVIHGIDAVYPTMIAQGRGQIVNIASGAGLAPRPGMTPYATTKAAVVALSTSLAPEAKAHGVSVHAVCPGYILTDIVKNTRFVNVDGARLMGAVPVKPMTPARCAEIALDACDRGAVIVPVGAHVWLDWIAFRASPSLGLWLAGWRARAFQKSRGSA